MSCAKLPAAEYADELIRALDFSDVVIVQGETGSGKSTILPLAAMQAGYRVVVTQPLRQTVRSLAGYVARLCDSHGIDGRVSYRIGGEHADSDQADLLYVTEGLELVRSLFDGDNSYYTVLFIDEAHKRTIGVDALMAWAKKVAACRGFKIVIMSATIDALRFSQYFDGAPIIDIVGRQFEIEDRDPKTGSIVEECMYYAGMGHDVEAFFPGKSDISGAAAALRDCGVEAEVLLFHSDLSASEIQVCLADFDRPKIILATNAAQDGLTIPGVSVVIDSGMERRVENYNGIERLILAPISLDSRDQRRGRSGRDGPGIYVDFCDERFKNARPRHDVPEIQRLSLDQFILRLMAAGFNSEKLDFMDPPNRSEVLSALQVLIALGCIDERKKVTPVGKEVARMTIGVRNARMVVEARKLGVVGDVVKVAALFEERSMLTKCTACRDSGKNKCLCGSSLYGGENESDALALLNLYNWCRGKTQNELRAAGVSPGSLRRVKSRIYDIVSRLERAGWEIESTGSREAILRSVIAGMIDRVFVFDNSTYVGLGYDYWNLDKTSAVSSGPRLVVAEPIVYKYGDGGSGVRRFLTRISAITPELYSELAPNTAQALVGYESYDQGMRYLAEKGCVAVGTTLRFCGVACGNSWTPAEPSQEAAAVMAKELASDGSAWNPELCAANREVLCQLDNLRLKDPTIPHLSLEDFYLERIGFACSNADLDALVEAGVNLVLKLEDCIPSQRIEQIGHDFPDEITISGKQFTVRYHSRGAASIRLDEAEDIELWRSLSKEILLPSGGEVEVVVFTSPSATMKQCTIYRGSACNARHFVLTRRDEAVWREWTRPSSVLSGDEIVIPAATIVETYGVSAFDGRPLLAYGSYKTVEDAGKAVKYELVWFRKQAAADCRIALANKAVGDVQLGALRKKAQDILRELPDASTLNPTFARDLRALEELALVFETMTQAQLSGWIEIATTFLLQTNATANELQEAVCEAEEHAKKCREWLESLGALPNALYSGLSHRLQNMPRESIESINEWFEAVDNAMQEIETFLDAEEDGLLARSTVNS